MLFFLSFTMSFTFQVGSTMLELGQQIYFPSYLKIGLYFLSALNFFFCSQSVFISYSLKMNYTTLFSRKIKELRCFQKITALMCVSFYSSMIKCICLWKKQQIHELIFKKTKNKGYDTKHKLFSVGHWYLTLSYQRNISPRALFLRSCLEV